jgi:hypothetical protein
MRYRPNWILLTLGGLVVVALFTYPAWRRFVNVTRAVDFADASVEEKGLFQGTIRRTLGPSVALTMYASYRTVIPAPTFDNPPLDTARYQPVLLGEFAEIDAIRKARGRAMIYRGIDNTLFLRFEEFSATYAPDLIVILSVNPAPRTFDEAQTGLYYRVAALKGTRGNQNYEIPTELQLNRYKSVVILSESLKAIYTFAVLN